MQFGIGCMECLLARHAEIAKKHNDREKGIAFLKEIMGAMATAPDGVAAPWLTPPFAEIIEKYYGPDGADHVAAKKYANEIMKKLMPELREQIRHAEDPLLMALSVARVCNYIDFNALYGKVDFDELRAMLGKAESTLPDGEEYGCFTHDLANAKELVYICDNAGEIIADRLLGDVLHTRYPSLKLTFAVRGKPAVNDALREDALFAGLDTLGSVIDNGSGISGTEFGYLGAEMADALERADVILAKGQGNFETMLGCGKNVYYLFLCKCSRFTDFFSVPMFTGMFVNERRLPKLEFDD